MKRTTIFLTLLLGACAPAGSGTKFSAGSSSGTPAPATGIAFDPMKASRITVSGAHLVGSKCPIRDTKEDGKTTFYCSFYDNESQQPYHDMKVTHFNATKKVGGTDKLANQTEVIDGVETHIVSLSLASLDNYTEIRPAVEGVSDDKVAMNFEPLEVDKNLIATATEEDKDYVWVFRFTWAPATIALGHSFRWNPGTCSDSTRALRQADSLTA